MKSSQQPKNPTNRIQKLNALLQQEVGEIIHPYLQSLGGLSTVSRVAVSGDSKWAQVWISIIGGDDDEILATLRNNVYDIQGELNRRIMMKMVPRLQFFLDTAPRYAQHIDELIRKVHEEEGGELWWKNPF